MHGQQNVNILQYVTTVIYGLTLGNAQCHSSYCQERFLITDIISLFLWRCGPNAGHGLLILEFSRSHTQRHISVCRNSLDEKLSARRRDLYLTNTQHSTQTSMHPAGFKPTIPACERPQTYTLDVD